MLARLFESRVGCVVLSLLIGCGLAAMFRPVCRSGACVVMRAPPLPATQGRVFRIDDNCFRYERRATACSVTSKVTSSPS